jgi:hypothetical protein
MIRLQIIDLFTEDQHPQVFAEKLDHIKRIREAWTIAREPTGGPNRVSFDLKVRISLSILALLQRIFSVT